MFLVSRVVSPSASMVVSVALLSLISVVVSVRVVVVFRLFPLSCALCVGACLPIALFLMFVFILRQVIWFVRSVGIIVHSVCLYFHYF